MPGAAWDRAACLLPASGALLLKSYLKLGQVTGGVCRGPGMDRPALGTLALPHRPSPPWLWKQAKLYCYPLPAICTLPRPLHRTRPVEMQGYSALRPGPLGRRLSWKQLSVLWALRDAGTHNGKALPALGTSHMLSLDACWGLGSYA